MGTLYRAIEQQFKTKPQQTRSFLNKIRKQAESSGTLTMAQKNKVFQFFKRVRKRPHVPVAGTLRLRRCQVAKATVGMSHSIKHDIRRERRRHPMANVPFPQLLSNPDLPPRRMSYDTPVPLTEGDDHSSRPPLPADAHVDLFTNTASIPLH